MADPLCLLSYLPCSHLSILPSVLSEAVEAYVFL
jgi:hypothetical protein